MKEIQLYCDGSSLGNPGKGGWGVVLLYLSFEKRKSGHSSFATNNQMELTAAIEGLKMLKEACNVSLFTDSQYVVKGMNEWIQSWIKNNWKNSQKKTIENKDLWIELLQESKKHDIKFVWVKGHADNFYNNIADKLATDASLGNIVNQ